jgi:6-phosphogluconolactonase
MMRELRMALDVCLAVAMLHGCASDTAAPCRGAESACGSVLVYVGTSTPFTNAAAGPARAHGIYAARLDKGSGQLAPLGLVAAFEGASWLVGHPSLRVLYSVGLTGNDRKAESSLLSFAVDQTSGQLRELNRTGAGGSDATHLAMDAASMTLFSANHNSGDVSAIAVLADGRLGKMMSLQKSSGTGPHPRQNRPQTHAVGIDPSGRYVVTTDFGADKLNVYRFDAATRALSPADKAFEALPAGSGPRHLVFHPDGKLLFVNCELSGDVRAYAWNSSNGTLQLRQSLSPYPASYVGARSAAEILVSRDGRFLYVSLRGAQDSLVVYAIDAGQGLLTEVQRTASGGKTPWSMALDGSGRWLLVANLGTDAVAVFKVDRGTGRITATPHTLAVPDPLTITFAPGR